MANAAEFDDMNATPLGKLPMPAVQTKGDAPRVDMGTSYSDILKEMSREASQPPAVAHQPSSIAHQQMHPPAVPAAPPTPPLQQQQLQLQQPHQQAHTEAFAEYSPPPPAESYGYGPPPPRAPVRLRRPTVVPRRRKPSVWHTLKEYKSSLLVAAIVFALLRYVAPKLAVSVPQLLTPSGRFNAMGLTIIALMAGGVHRLADHYA